MGLEPGAVINERYRLLAPLASGGMGTVWRARHLELDVDVAVKLVSAEVSRTPLAEKRFRREAQAAARLRSPHIVQVLDFGTHEGHPYLAMELLAGEDLATRLEREGRLSPEVSLRVLEGVTKALGVAHGAGIVHRDLKPANIFLEQVAGEEVVKVLDFGIAKDLRSAPDAQRTTANGVVGSPAYMSPEQVWGEEVSSDADTWAMGVVAYECLTGENPFQHEVLAQVFDRIVKAKVQSPRELVRALPEATDAVFVRALARKASERFSSPAELLAALRAALELNATRRSVADANAETVAAPVVGPPDIRLRSRVAPLAAIVVVVVLVVVFALRARHAEEVPPSTSPGSGPASVSPTASVDAPIAGQSAPSASPAEASAEIPPVTPSVRALPLRPPAPVQPSARPPSSAAPAPSVDPKWGVPVPVQ